MSRSEVTGRTDTPQLDKLEALSGHIYKMLHGEEHQGAFWLSAVAGRVQALVDFAATFGIVAGGQESGGQKPQSQASLADQLAELAPHASKLGLYDAADFLGKFKTGAMKGADR